MLALVKFVDQFFSILPENIIFAAIDKPFRLYLHIPWCNQICGFCTLPRQVLLKSQQLDTYTNALTQQIHAVLGQMSQPVQEIYLGGGTPSLLSYQHLQTLLGAARQYQHAANLQVTLEAHTCDINPAYLNTLLSAGINRISTGIQSLDQTERSILGLPETGDQILSHLVMLKDYPLLVNFDLIYGSAGQQIPAWRNTLERVLSLQPHQISAYPCLQLIGTPMSIAARRTRNCTSQRTFHKLVEILLIQTSQAGYRKTDPFTFTRTDVIPFTPVYQDYNPNLPILGLGSNGATSITSTKLAVNPYTAEAYCQRMISGSPLELLVSNRRAFAVCFHAAFRLALALVPPTTTNVGGVPGHLELTRAYLAAGLGGHIYRTIRNWLTLTSRVGFTTTPLTSHLKKDHRFRQALPAS